MPRQGNYRPWNAGHWLERCKASESPTMRDIAWAAGVYEGEGYAALITYKGRSPKALVNIDQKDSWLCHRLRALFGGTVTERSIKARSPKDPDLRRTYHRWQLHGPRALGFIQTVYALLSPRRQGQIKLVVDGLRRAN